MKGKFEEDHGPDLLPIILSFAHVVDAEDH
jgi:hypothetical protein